MVRLLIFIFAILSTGCYFRASIRPITETENQVDPGSSIPLSENHHFIPGAQTSTSSTRSYKKSSIVGHHQEKIFRTSSTRNYKLYSTVEGQIISSGK